MDCMTISTFRSLEQQAIRQYKETQRKELNYKYETFGQEKVQMLKAFNLKNEPTTETTIGKEKINYFA